MTTAFEAYTRAAEICREPLHYIGISSTRLAAWKECRDAILALRDALPAVQNDTPASEPCVRAECCRLRKLINEHYGPENSRLKDELSALSETPASGTAKVPEKVSLPCGCYTYPQYDGCTCGNYDDARSQGYAQGWNDAIDAMIAAAPSEQPIWEHPAIKEAQELLVTAPNDTPRPTRVSYGSEAMTSTTERSAIGLLREARASVFHVAEESQVPWNRRMARDLLDRIDALLAQPEQSGEARSVEDDYEPPAGWHLTCDKCGIAQGDKQGCGWPTNCPTGVAATLAPQGGKEGE